MSHDEHCERGMRVRLPQPLSSAEPAVWDNRCCHCHKRAREASGCTRLPSLRHRRCTGCGMRVSRYEDGAACYRCAVSWDYSGRPYWADDYGNLGEPVTTATPAGEYL